MYLNPRSNKPGQWTNHDKPSLISLDLSKHQPTGKKNKLRCYPQQLESFCAFAIKSAFAKRLCHKNYSKCLCHKKHRNISEPFGISQNICQNHREPNNVSAPEPSGTSSSIFSAQTLRNLTRYLHQNPPEPHHASSPRPSGTAQNPPEPQQVSSPEPSGTSRGICTGTLRNLTRHLHLDPPEPHRVAAPETSGTSQGICPEPSGTSQGICPEPSGTSQGICTVTLHNLVQDLVLKLHRIAPELIWARDPMAKFCWGMWQ